MGGEEGFWESIFVVCHFVFALCDNVNRFCFRLFLQLLWLNGDCRTLNTIVQRCRFIVQHCAETPTDLVEVAQFPNRLGNGYSKMVW